MTLQSELARGRLTWWPEIGVGFYPVENSTAPYDAAYFERVKTNAATKIGVELMEARSNFVSKHWTGVLTDVGIGSGTFIERRLKHGFITFGYDINPLGVTWLNE